MTLVLVGGGLVVLVGVIVLWSKLKNGSGRSVKCPECSTDLGSIKAFRTELNRLGVDDLSQYSDYTMPHYCPKCGKNVKLRFSNYDLV